jgi:hypothetical protein
MTSDGSFCGMVSEVEKLACAGKVCADGCGLESWDIGGLGAEPLPQVLRKCGICWV